MNIKLLTKSAVMAALAFVAMGVTSCDQRKFRVEGTITDAKDSTLYFENMSLNGAVAIDSVKLGDDGAFSFDCKSVDAPEFYRLRIAGQIINIAIDSTETVGIKASYPTMASGYEVSGSEECAKIKQLTVMQMNLQSQVNAIASNPALGVDAVADSVTRVIEDYKQNVKLNYIFKEPMRAYSYFALFQTINLGRQATLIFNPRNSEEDIKVFAAVATSWDTFYPEAERGKNLHNIAIEGMKDIRIVRNKQVVTQIEASRVNTTGVIDITLPDNRGNMRTLSQLKGHVVMLDFHSFADENSMKRIMVLRELYNKYHAAGFEIYQVSVDGDEHFWKTQTAALPWVCVHASENDANVITNYNVQGVPTFFLLDKNCNVYKRDAQIADLDTEIKSLLK